MHVAGALHRRLHVLVEVILVVLRDVGLAGLDAALILSSNSAFISCCTAFCLTAWRTASSLSKPRSPAACAEQLEAQRLVEQLLQVLRVR